MRLKATQEDLIVAAEQRIGVSPVLAASAALVDPRGSRSKHVLALTEGILWFLEPSRDFRRVSLGKVLGWRSLAEYALAIPERPFGRFDLELSRVGELLEARLYGAGAVGMVSALVHGQLTAQAPLPV